MNKISVTLILLFLTITTGCSFHTYNAEYTQIKIPEYRKPDSILLISEDSTMASIIWKDYYTDRNLKSLIDTALIRNLTLYSAILQIDKANSAVSRCTGEFFPSINLNISQNQVKNHQISHPFNAHGAGISISNWELDLWGKIRSTKKAKYAAMLKETAVMQGVKVKLIADIASLYYRLIGLDAKLRAIDKIIANNKLYLDEQEKRLSRGTEPQKDYSDNYTIGITRTNIAVEQAKAELFKAKSIKPTILRDIFIAENAINLLLSREHTTIPRSELQELLSDKIISDTMYLGVPADLIRFRPDIMAAEYAVIEAYNLKDAAKAAQYPTLTLNANIATEENARSSWSNFSSSIVYNLFSGLTIPLFRRGELKYNKRIKEIEQDQKVANYKHAVLSACTEVSNTLMLYKMNHIRIVNLNKQYESLLKARAFSQHLNKSLKADYLDVMAAQSQLLQTQLELSDAFIEYYHQRVALFKALGGGAIQ